MTRSQSKSSRSLLPPLHGQVPSAQKAARPSPSSLGTPVKTDTMVKTMPASPSSLMFATPMTKKMKWTMKAGNRFQPPFGAIPDLLAACKNNQGYLRKTPLKNYSVESEQKINPELCLIIDQDHQIWYQQRLTIPSDLPSPGLQQAVAIIMEERCPIAFLCAYLKEHEHQHRTKTQTKALIRIIKEMILEAYDISTKIISNDFIGSYIAYAARLNKEGNAGAEAKGEVTNKYVKSEDVKLGLERTEACKSAGEITASASSEVDANAYLVASASVLDETSSATVPASQTQLDRLTSCLTTMAEQQVSAQQQQMSFNDDSKKMINKLSEGQQKLAEGQQKLSEGLLNVKHKVDTLGFTQDAQGKFMNDLNNRMKKLQNQVDSQQIQIDSKLDSDDFFEYAEANDAVIAERSDEDDDDDEDQNEKFAPRSLFAPGDADTSISSSKPAVAAASFGSISSAQSSRSSSKPTAGFNEFQYRCSTSATSSTMNSSTTALFSKMKSSTPAAAAGFSSMTNSSTSAPAGSYGLMDPVEKYKPPPVPPGTPDFGETSTIFKLGDSGSAPKVTFGQDSTLAAPPPAVYQPSPPALAQPAANPFTFGSDPDSSSAVAENFGFLTDTMGGLRSTRGKPTYSLAEFSKNRSKVAPRTTAVSVGYGGGGSGNTSDRRKGKRSSSDLPSDDDDDDYNRSSTGHQKTHRKNQS